MRTIRIGDFVDFTNDGCVMPVYGGKYVGRVIGFRGQDVRVNLIPSPFTEQVGSECIFQLDKSYSIQEPLSRFQLIAIELEDDED